MNNDVEGRPRESSTSDVRISISLPGGPFDTFLRSIEVEVSVADELIDSHIAHPSIRLTLPIRDDENYMAAREEARQALEQMFDLSVLVEWVQRRRRLG